MKYVVAFLITCLAAQAYAEDVKLQTITFEFVSIQDLWDSYPYLKEEQKKQDAFEKENSDISPLIIHTATYSPTALKRNYILILQLGDMWCHGMNCPLRVFDITNVKRPKFVLELMTTSSVKAKDCKDQFSFLFRGENGRWVAWAPTYERFTPRNSYETLVDASVCEPKRY